MKSTICKKVIYIVDYPLGTRDAERFGLAKLQLAGLQVSVWDLSHFLLPAASKLEIKSPSWVDLTVCLEIGHFRDLCSSLTSEDIVILIGGLGVGQAWRGRKILRLICATPARLASISTGNVPTPIHRDSLRWLFATRAKKVYSSLTHLSWWKRVPELFASHMLSSALAAQQKMRIPGAIRSLDHIWAGVAVSGTASYLVAPSTTVTYIHEFDYDLVLALRATDRKSSPRVVFIDSKSQLHPDIAIHGTSVGMPIEVYSHIVCRALDEIEKRLENQVVIAVHPRAAPGVMEPWYGGRTLIYGQTSELIADATAVIVAESSTAIGLAAIFQRPLVLLSSNRSDLYIRGMNRAFAEALDTQLIDLDAPDLPHFTMDINEQAYERYVQKYIKRQGTPAEPFWSVVAYEIISGTRNPI